VEYVQNTCLVQPNSYFLLYLSHKINVTDQIANKLKYSTVRTCPIKIKGVSTGRAPIHVSRTVVLSRIHKII